MNKKILLLTTLSSMILFGCSLAPNYERPELPVTADWIENDTNVEIQSWHEQFSDPDLRLLIEIGLQNNKDLQQTVLKVAEYKAKFKIARDELFPSVIGTGTYSKSHNTQMMGEYSKAYSVGGALSWEIDLFGKIRNQKNVVLETYFALYENQKSAQISLIASIATAYYTYVADKELLDLYKETLTTEQDSYKLTKEKYNIGSASELEITQAQTAVATAEISVANYERILKLDENQLLFLVGTNLPKINSLKKVTDIDVKPISVGSKTDLLEQRPDIIAAEHQLKAANYNIGVARAALFPSISLSAGLGTIASDSSDLFKSSSKYWSFAPSLALPIFNMALYDNLDVVDIEKKIAILNYEKTIQVAFKEVSDAMKSFSSLTKQYSSQMELYKVAKKYFELADLRYTQGVDSYLTRLDAQRQYVSARQGLVSTKLMQLMTQINLYKAIGGGWGNQNSEEIKE